MEKQKNFMNKSKEKILKQYRSITGKSFLKLNEFLLDTFPNSENSLSIYFNHIKPELDKTHLLLDAGCGNGTHSRNTNARTFGIDIDFNKIKEAQENQKNDIVRSSGRPDDRTKSFYFLGSCEYVPFKKNTFDTILCHSVVEHLKNPNQVFKEFSRVLKKKGKLIILTSNILNPFYLANKILFLSIRKKLSAILTRSINRTPTYYKANYVSALDHQLKQYNFLRLKLIYGIDVPICLKNPYIYLWKYLNRFLLVKPLNFLLPIFCAIYIKK